MRCIIVLCFLLRRLFGVHEPKEVGLPPGSLVHVGEKRDHKPVIEVIDYGPDHLVEREVENVAECAEYKDSDSVTWVNVTGVHEPKLVKEVGDRFGLHALLLEDVLNTRQRPKVEEYGDAVFVIARMIWYDSEQQLRSEQVSFVLSDSFVLSFQELPGDVFTPLRERLRSKSGRIRSRGSDYLLYALLDMLVDNYFLVAEQVGVSIEELEERILSNYSSQTINDVHSLKREVINLQRVVWPLREVTSHLLRTEHSAFAEDTLLFLRDLHDHSVQVIETMQLSREMINGMVDLSMSQASNRMNEVMKVLTIIATIFIPLTFIAGIYGMNFEYMPELSWYYGYFLTLGVMVLVTAGMLVFFRRREWL